MCFSLEIKSFSFDLLKPLKTSQGILQAKQGFLIHLKNKAGRTGWGEVSSINQSEFENFRSILKNLGKYPSRNELEASVKVHPGSLAFGIGCALSEIDGLIGSNSHQKWLRASQSAILLSTEKSPITQLESILNSKKATRKRLTIKWKVGRQSNEVEKKLIDELLTKLPSNALLRIDVNGGWSREQAMDWANYLKKDTRLEWIEQPLDPKDIEGHQELSKKIPIALDESLLCQPSLRKTWKSWQIRRPLLEGDPREFLKEFKENAAYKVITTSFETGIGLRWINHFAALQERGPTPTAPGLAPGWHSHSLLFSDNPKLVWQAA